MGGTRISVGGAFWGVFVAFGFCCFTPRLPPCDLHWVGASVPQVGGRQAGGPVMLDRQSAQLGRPGKSATQLLKKTTQYYHLD